MSKPITVASCKFVHTTDIDADATRAGGDKWEGLVNICVQAAQDALDTPPTGYTPTQRNSLTDLFGSMRATHRGIRTLLKLGDGEPASVDALVLARLQLEGLYTVCLLTEGAEHVTRFVAEAWKRQFIRWMLYREETKGLARFSETDKKEQARLITLAQIWGITDGQRSTIEIQELETEAPRGFVRQPIKPFPTPGQLITEIPEGPKKRMLERLYPEYQELCAYAHGRPVAGFGKGIFDDRSPMRREFAEFHKETDIHELFSRSVLGPAQLFSLGSVAQATAELTALYPASIELRSATTRAWNELHNSHLLMNAVWSIRTKDLLGATN
jgi:hypothetical protein